jgi:hypothetical protein
LQFDGYAKILSILSPWPQLTKQPFFLCSDELLRVASFKPGQELKHLSLVYAGGLDSLKSSLEGNLSEVELKKSGIITCRGIVEDLGISLTVYESIAALESAVRVAPVYFQRLALSLETGVLIGVSASMNQFADRLLLGKVLGPVVDGADFVVLVNWCLRYKIRPSQFFTDRQYLPVFDFLNLFGLPLMNWMRDEPFFAWILSDLLDHEAFSPEVSIWIAPLIEAMTWWEHNYSQIFPILKTACNQSHSAKTLPEMGVIKFLFCFSFCDLARTYLDEDLIQWYLRSRPWMDLLKQGKMNEEMLSEIYSGLIREYGPTAPVSLWLFLLRGMVSEPYISEPQKDYLSFCLGFCVSEQNTFDQFLGTEKSRILEDAYYLAFSAWLDKEIRTKAQWMEYLDGLKLKNGRD